MECGKLFNGNILLKFNIGRVARWTDKPQAELIKKVGCLRPNSAQPDPSRVLNKYLGKLHLRIFNSKSYVGKEMPIKCLGGHNGSPVEIRRLCRTTATNLSSVSK